MCASNEIEFGQIGNSITERRVRLVLRLVNVRERAIAELPDLNSLLALNLAASRINYETSGERRYILCRDPRKKKSVIIGFAFIESIAIA